MNKTYTLKELAEMFAYKRRGALADGQSIERARMLALRHVLSAIGYELPKDEEREAFERWRAGLVLHPEEATFEAWKAGREELRRSINKEYATPEKMEKDIQGLVPKEPAWIPWAGGECPVSMNCRRLEVRFRDGREYLTDGAYRLIWTHSGARGDILAYRVWEG